MDAERQPKTTYVLGHSGQELERLISQAKLYEPFTMQFFRDAGIAEGMRVLDVGCGPGEVSLIVAELVGEAGRVLGVDASAEAIQAAQARVRAAGFTNISFTVGDLLSLELDQDFDAIVGRCILMHLADPVAVLRSLTRYLRPGGVVVF